MFRQDSIIVPIPWRFSSSRNRFTRCKPVPLVLTTTGRWRFFLTKWGAKS
jgi:hypothetical protein